jgi:hypothetical protein
VEVRQDKALAIYRSVREMRRAEFIDTYLAWKEVNDARAGHHIVETYWKKYCKARDDWVDGEY